MFWKKSKWEIIAFVVLVSFISISLVHKHMVSKEKARSQYVIPVSKTPIYIEKMNPRIDPAIRKLISDAVDEGCKTYNLDPEMVVSLIHRESQFKPWAMSFDEKTKKPIAYGLMQIHYKVHDDIQARYSINQICEIRTNVLEGCRILHQYIASANGDINIALGRYVNSQGFTSYKKDILSQAAIFYAMR